MSDERLLDYLRTKIIKLRKNGTTANFDKEKHYSQMGQCGTVDKWLQKRTNGYFVEGGAADGVRLSNTLFFEISREWTGLLIEPGRDLFQDMLKTNRNVLAYNGCLSPNTYPQILNFQESEFLSGIPELYEESRKDEMARTAKINYLVECVPLYSLLLALNVTYIDYFSLDTEGSELSILQTIPFDKIQIDVLSVEWVIWKGLYAEAEAKKEKIKAFIAKTDLFEKPMVLEGDLLFRRKGLTTLTP